MPVIEDEVQQRIEETNKLDEVSQKESKKLDEVQQKIEEKNKLDEV